MSEIPSTQPPKKQVGPIGPKPVDGLYKKPELTKHDDLSQITFSTHPASPPPASPTSTVGRLAEVKKSDDAQIAQSEQRIVKIFEDAAKSVTIDPTTKRRI